MVALEFDAPGTPVSMNERNRLHWAAYRRHSEAWQEAAAWAWKLRPAKATGIGRCEVKVTLPFKRRGRRDPHNYTSTTVKSIIDGLVQAGAWPDDTPEFVRVAEPEFAYGTNQVTVLLKEIEADD